MSNKERTLEFLKTHELLIGLFNKNIRKELSADFQDINTKFVLNNELLFSLEYFIMEEPYLYMYLNQKIKQKLDSNKEFLKIMKGVEKIRETSSLITAVKHEFREIALRDPEIFSIVSTNLEIDDLAFNKDNIKILLGLIEDESMTNVGNITNANCPKCDSTKATYRKMTMWADEEDLIIYRCVKCKCSWRSGGISGI